MSISDGDEWAIEIDKKEENIQCVFSRHLESSVYLDMKMIGKRASGTTIVYYIAFLTYVNVTEIADGYVYINIVLLNLIRVLSSKNEKKTVTKSFVLHGFLWSLHIHISEEETEENDDL